MNLKDYKNVWIFAQAQRGKLSPTAYELLTAGRQLADTLHEKLCAVLLGHNVKNFAQDLINHGADVVYVCDDPALENYVDDVYARVLADMVAQYKPNKFLIPATNMGRSLSAKTAVFVGTGLTADATDVTINEADGQLHATRPTFGGNLMATITCAKIRPEMCSLRPMAYEKAPAQKGRKGEVIEFPYDAKKHACALAKFMEFIQSKGEGLDLSEAEVIVAGGRGVGNPPNCSGQTGIASPALTSSTIVSQAFAFPSYRQGNPAKQALTRITAYYHLFIVIALYHKRRYLSSM